ncbi:MAG: glycosyltransferase family 1 protein [Aquabacterium sp.]|uniref:glycosyltransferase family 4 protein n=1 Tax=Aquabacterium sp. TaxID=1872578 RepID=UPI00120B97DB|nr:glycosyltransferase family 1 protein [Aquabacterium sp.]TAK93182.1 MAG: glycosyltransferase family 1 protein [Aquabacterium sp.]
MPEAVTQLVINGRFLQRPVTGVERFAVETLTALDQLLSVGALPALSVELVVPKGTEPRVHFQNIPIKQVGRRQGHFWEQIDLPIYCGARRLVNLCNTAPIFKKNQIVVIHDAAVFSVPQAFSAGFRLAYKIIHMGLALVGARILTVSEFSRQDLANHLPMVADRISVLPESAEHLLRHQPDPAILARENLGSRPYVLAVSSMAAHKNFSLVLEALTLLDAPPFDVAIAGGGNAKVFGEGGKVASDRIKWLGYVSDSELRALYEGAMCFVFPSIYEGFGIPPLEAMQCGCPVLAANAASIPEVCGDAAMYFDPRDAAQLAQLLLSVADDHALRETLRQKGLARAKEFTWKQVAQALVKQGRLLEGTAR